jgi:glycosyltransferase involved in cell wall biosynthesis
VGGDLEVVAGSVLLMRILYLITRAELGGAQSHLLQLVRAAAGEHEVTVATGEEGAICEQARALSAKVIVLRHLRHEPHPWHDLAGLAEICRMIRGEHPDVLHAHSGKAGLLGRIAAKICGVPAVYTAHGFAFTDEAPRWTRAAALIGEWIAARTGATTIAVSEGECRLAMRHRISSLSRMVVVHNGCETLAHTARPEHQPPIIVMVARFAPPKRQDVLLRAFSNVSEIAQLWLVGDGPQLESARSLATELGIADKVTFLGARCDVPQLLAQAHVATLISEHEGFGLSLIEAMSAGLPVVASDVGGVREIVLPNETGYLVANGDEGALVTALRRLIQDPTLRKRMGAAGRYRQLTFFAADRMVRDTFKVYDEITGRGTAERVRRCARCSYPAPCESR